MELRQVEYFLAVAEHDGIGGAAAALGVAQPTVSQALRALERELGVQLFHRIGRGMVLSSAGHSMLGPARQILREVAGVDDLLAVSADVLTGRLEVLVAAAVDSEPVVELIAEFGRNHPEVTVGLGDLRDETRAAVAIEDGHCEFVIAHLPIAGEGLDVIVLGEEEYVLVYPPGTDLPDGPIPLDELPQQDMVFVPRGYSVADEIEEAIRVSGTRPPIAVLSNLRDVRIPMVAAGIGGTIAARAAAENAPDVVMRTVTPKMMRPFAIAFDRGGLSPVGAAFVELIESRVAPAG